MADTDVIVLLDSPGFLASRWTTQELAKANSTNIQVLQLIWPGNKLEANAAFSRALILESSDFQKTTGIGSRLKEATVQRIVTEAESLRARPQLGCQPETITRIKRTEYPLGEEPRGFGLCGGADAST